MKHTTRLIVSMALVALLTGCALKPPAVRNDAAALRPAQQPAAAKVLLVTGEYAPYTSEKLPDKGRFVLIVAAVLQEADIEYEIRFYPWARCQEMVRTGQAWASFPYGYSATTARTYLLSEPILSARHKYFYLKTNQAIAANEDELQELAAFKDHVFGGANGYWYGSRTDLAALELTKIQWADDIYGLVRMLHSRRIDVFIEDDLVGWEVINRLYQAQQDQFATLERDAKLMDYFLIVSKQYPRSEELLTKFNDALRRLEENGTLQRLKSR